MPTAPPLSRPSARPRSRGAGLAVAVIAAVATVLALLVMTSSLLTGPDRVDLAVENPTPYELEVQVRGADGGSVHQLGPIASGSTREFTGVIDQGDTWLFEFSYGGVLAAELTVERSGIEAGTVVVPDSAEEVLDDSDLPPPPG